MKVITQAQILKYFSLHVYATILAFFIGSMLRKSGFNTPHGVIIGAAIGLTITYISYRFALRRPNEFFIDYGKQIVGRWIHYPVLLLFLLSNIMTLSINLWVLQDYLTQYYLIDTPSWVVVASCGACIAYTARFGITSVFRTAEGIFYVCLVSFFLMPFLVRENIQWFMMKGFITHTNFAEAWPTGYFIASMFGEMSFIIYIMPYIHQVKKSMRSLLNASIIVIVIVIIHIIMILLTLGVDLARNINFHEHEIIRFIKTGSYLETLDPALIALWLFSIFVKLSFIVFVTSQIISQSLKLKHSRSIVVPITIFACVCTLCLAYSRTQFFTLLNGGLITLLIATECMPILYYIVDSIKMKWRSKSKKNEVVRQ